MGKSTQHVPQINQILVRQQGRPHEKESELF